MPEDRKPSKPPVYSLTKLLDDEIARVRGNKHDADLIERSISERIRNRRGRDHDTKGGITIPDRILRDLDADVYQAAGGFIGVETLDPIDAVRPASIMGVLGVGRMGGLVGDQHWPYQDGTARSGVGWLAKDGTSTVPEANEGAKEYALTPRTMGYQLRYTRMMGMQTAASGGLEAWLRRQIALNAEEETERVYLHGTGADGQPTGLLNAPDVARTAWDTMGLGPNYGQVVDFFRDCAIANGGELGLKFLCSPTAAAQFRQSTIATTINQADFLIQRRNPGAGASGVLANTAEIVVSNHCPDATLICGRWPRSLVAEWGGTDVVVDPYTFGLSGGVRLTCFKSIDVLFPHPETFAVATWT